MPEVISNEITLGVKEYQSYLQTYIDHNRALAADVDRLEAAGKSIEGWQGNRRVVGVFGPPGSGKSASNDQVAARNGLVNKITIASSFDPTALGGIDMPDLANNRAIRLKPTWLEELEAVLKDGCALWTLDEFPQASPFQQNVLAQPIHEHRIGRYQLPRAVTIAIAGNRQQDRAATNPIPAHVRDRFTYVTMQPTFADWKEHAFKSGVHPDIITYLSRREEQLQAHDPQANKSPTQRGWSKASVELYACEKAGLSENITHAGIAGQVGPAAANDFMAVRRILKEIPDPQFVLANPETAKLPGPDKPDVLWALVTSLSFLATDKNIAAFFKVAKRLPPELAATCIADALRRDETLQYTKEAVSWLATDGAEIFIIQ